MKHNHALIDPKTGLVRNVIVWEGAEWTPPRDHYVVHDCEGTPGDYWDQDNKCFYTPRMKRRFRDEHGKCGEKDLNEDEKKRNVAERLKKIYEHAEKLYRCKFLPDLTQQDVEVPTE